MTLWADGSSTLRASSLLEARTRVPGAVYAADDGVVADGTTNDAAALQAAINRAKATVGGSDRNTVYLPKGYMMVGSKIILRNGVRFVGVGKRASVIKAISGTFPTNTPVVELGDYSNALGFGAEPIVFDVRLENLGIDCNNIANSTGMYSRAANEGSGMFEGFVTGYNKYGVWFDDGCSIVGSQNLEIFSGNLGTGLAGFYGLHCAGQNWLKGMTTIPTTGSGIIIQNSQWNLSDIHPEACVSGIRINDASCCEISDVHGHSACPIVVQLDSNTGKCIVTNVMANGSAATLNDDFKGLNLAADFVFYTQSAQPPPVATITYSASMTPNALMGNFQRITVTNGTAMTINAPSNPKNGQELTFDILNSSGGAMGAITWNAVFKLAGAFTNPASTKRRTIRYYYDGTNWVEINRAAADI